MQYPCKGLHRAESHAQPGVCLLPIHPAGLSTRWRSRPRQHYINYYQLEVIYIPKSTDLSVSLNKVMGEFVSEANILMSGMSRSHTAPSASDR